MNTYLMRSLFCIGLPVMFFQATDAQWRQTNGPWGGTIMFFAVGDSAILVKSEDNGVFRSTDGGTSWTPADSVFWGDHQVNALTAHGNVFFAGTDSGVFRSTDKGASWTVANSGLPSEGTLQISILFSGPGGIFAGTYGMVTGRKSNIYRSTDDGAHWTDAGAGLGGNSFIQCIIANGNSFFAGLWKQGVWLSTNNGDNWTPANSGFEDTTVIGLAAGGGAVFARANGGSVFRSTDNGASWTAINSGLPNTTDYYFDLPLLRSDAALFAGTDHGIFRSIDQVESWTEVNSGLLLPHVRSLAASGSDLFAGTEGGGIFRSTDNGSNWIPVNSGLRSASIVRALSAVNGSLLEGAGDRSIATSVFASTDNGVHWADIAASFANDTGKSGLDLVMAQGGAVFAGISFIRDTTSTFFTATGGAPWTHVKSGLVEGYFWKYEIRSFTSTANALFIGTTTGVARSIDGGATWSEPDSMLHYYPIYSLISKNGTIVAGSDGGAFVSSDEGMTWKKVPFGLMGMRVEALALCGDALFAGSSYDGVFRSADNGASWSAVNTGLATTSVFSLISHDSTLFAGTFGKGVFMSIDKGATWRPFTMGIPEMSVYSLAASGGELFAGTEGYGVWHRPLSEAGVISDGPERKASVQLHFDLRAPGITNSCLTIGFSLSYPDHVAIALYSLSGKLVAHIVDKRLEAGSYSFQWDSRTMARGCYLVRMLQGNHSFSKIIHLVH